MSESHESISRLSAWLRDYGDQSTPQFEDDVRRVLTLAKEAADLRENLEKCREAIGWFDDAGGHVPIYRFMDSAEYKAAKEACGL